MIPGSACVSCRLAGPERKAEYKVENMPSIVLPFELKRRRNGDDACNVLDLLSKQAKEAFRKSPHVTDYIQALPIENFGIPKYYAVLDKSLGADKNPNCIYPGKGEVFIHIISDNTDGRNVYIPIEPTSMMKIGPLMAEIEKRLLDMAEELGSFSMKTLDDQTAAFAKCIDRIAGMQGPGAKPAGFLPKKLNRCHYRPGKSARLNILLSGTNWG